MEFDKTLKRPWDLPLVSNIIGFHSFSSHTLQAQLCLCSKDDFCYTCNANQTQNFKYHKTNPTLIIRFPPTWYYFLCLQFPTLISSGPPSHVPGHRKTLPYRNHLSADASIHWCRCISILKLQQSSLHVMFVTSEDVIFTMTKGGSLDRHWSYYNVIGPIFGVGWAINIQTTRFTRFFQHLSLTLFLLSYC